MDDPVSWIKAPKGTRVRVRNRDNIDAPWKEGWAIRTDDDGVLGWAIDYEEGGELEQHPDNVEDECFETLCGEGKGFYLELVQGRLDGEAAGLPNEPHNNPLDLDDATAGADSGNNVSLMRQGTFALDFARVLCRMSTLFCADLHTLYPNATIVARPGGAELRGDVHAPRRS